MSRIGTREEYHNLIWKWVMWKDNCIFCDEKKIQDTLLHILQYWKIILNKYPYSGQENHLMAVPIRHVQFVWELNSDEFSELPKVHKYMKDFFDNDDQKDYFSATRETMWNRSIEHYHIHFIPGKLQWKFVRCMLENQGYPIDAEVKIQN